MADVQIAYVALGSNLQDPVLQVKSGLAALGRLPDTCLVARSSLYRTAPVGRAAQPDFVNAVARVDTQLEPDALLQALLDIERQHARVRLERNGPRTLDLDLLLYGRRRIDLPGLTVPHPRMHQRAFVLVPLAEIAPDLDIPGAGRVADLAARAQGQAAVRIDG
jgi:2-amino-4-hydroxy-6-hydroxymethyldihydropteridine diphosphokinase